MIIFSPILCCSFIFLIIFFEAQKFNFDVQFIHFVVYTSNILGSIEKSKYENIYALYFLQAVYSFSSFGGKSNMMILLRICILGFKPDDPSGDQISCFLSKRWQLRDSNTSFEISPNSIIKYFLYQKIKQRVFSEDI